MKINEIEVRPIPTFPDYYISHRGEVWSEKSLKWLKFHFHMGSLCIHLSRGDSSTATPTVGRLVLETWLYPCPEGMECCHNDGDTCNNILENLRWDTHKANMQDAVKHGSFSLHYHAPGEASPVHKLSTKNVHQIRHILKETHISDAEVARAYTVSTTCIRRIRLEQTWRHLLCK